MLPLPSDLKQQFSHFNLERPSVWEPSASQITEDILLGNLSAALDFEGTHKRHNITAVVTLIDPITAAKMAELDEFKKLGDKHHVVVCIDKDEQRLLPHLPGICAFIESQLGTTPTNCTPPTQASYAHATKASSLVPAAATNLSAAAPTAQAPARPTPRILVHCVAGRSRSPTAVAAYLMKSRAINVAQALQMIQSARPCANPRDTFWAELRLWSEFCCDASCTPPAAVAEAEGTF
ncbi:protein-tyrosine phosphatase-like protein [Lasiosphaeria miniovina]|uniref:protein-tyrosine-phosphatase n=1 Tax=Lasiosphaeria miniovina TaxID=1954250 RepID=A0AA40DYL2_9PEZI|nr:protein-tyrosine phosphatase-like protein [Lasiosphaeria miniovina]KAK0717756.1 protein-tyrosine phosphatase-like protein [Lasiosphaeria miniovina]